jgi:hypothetical protein
VKLASEQLVRPDLRHLHAVYDVIGAERNLFKFLQLHIMVFFLS